MAWSKTILRIAVIEKNPDDFTSIRDHLKEEIDQAIIHRSANIDEFERGLSAGVPCDAILLSLPDNDAHEEVVRKIVQLAGDTPLVILAGSFDKNFMVKAVSLGASDYLVKDSLSSAQLFKSVTYSIEHKRIQLQLNRSERNYRNLFHFNPIPTWVYDVETYGFLNVNEAAIRHYGYSREEFAKMTLKDIRPVEDVPMLEHIIKSHKNTGKAGFGNYRHLKKTGEVIHVDIQSNNIEFAGKKARLVLAMDISERVKYTQAIENQNRLLRDIAWTQSHVVRAPLARMMGLIDILSKNGPCPKTHEEILPSILNAAAELDVVIREIVQKTYVDGNWKIEN